MKEDRDDVPLVVVNIQNVIQERKAERKLKAEKKRQADLQRIRDMKSTTGIDPLQRFPKEIWTKIFDELDPEDRGNVWEVHPLFRDILEQTRIRDILFPQILQVDAFQSAMHQIVKKRWDGQLRCISKCARDSFDRGTEKSLLRRIHESYAESSCWNSDAVNLCCGDTSDALLLKNLSASFAEGGGKFFFPRALSVYFFDKEMRVHGRDQMMEVIEQFKSDVSTLLERIGRHILQFRFYMNVEDFDPEIVPFSCADVYLLLQGWISLVPNLRWLEVMIKQPYQMIEGPRRSQRMAVAESTFRSHPFPRLPDLERLTFHSSYQQRTNRKLAFLNIYKVILQANQHIKLLDLDDRDRSSFDDFKLLPPHLTQSLQLRRFTVGETDWGDVDAYPLQRIELLLNFNCPLQTLALGICSDQKGQSLSSVFRFLGRFPTLETLKLTPLDDFSIGDTDKFGYLELPNLKEFEMDLTSPEIDFDSNIHFFFSLQFLVKCGKLKRISWQLAGVDDLKLRENLIRMENRNFGRMIDFRGGLRYLYGSNIWHVFPDLDALEVGIRKDKNSGSSDCRHDYQRADMETMTIQKYLKKHDCNRCYGLKFCVL